MSTPYIPSKDSLALAWMQTFSQGIQSDPAKYMISPVEAAAIVTAVDLFAAAY
jgi:hypothetical protein